MSVMKKAPCMCVIITLSALCSRAHDRLIIIIIKCTSLRADDASRSSRVGLCTYSTCNKSSPLVYTFILQYATEDIYRVVIMHRHHYNTYEIFPSRIALLCTRTRVRLMIDVLICPGGAL